MIQSPRSVNFGGCFVLYNNKNVFTELIFCEAFIRMSKTVAFRHYKQKNKNVTEKYFFVIFVTLLKNAIC